MNDQDAREFLAGAVGDARGAWADVGAGTGTFTRALRSLLSSNGRIYAIDRDSSAVAALKRLGDNVIAINADFTKDLSLPELVDGMLLANALHFAPNATTVLADLVKLVKPRGRIVIIEYDQRAASRWVPYPIPSRLWATLAAAAGLLNPAVIARRKSAYAGELYIATAERE
jgi:ubiquinone/menaquinone biosynthesis C-methylase UbiE